MNTQIITNTKGFTLVEVMVSLALGSLMLLGIFKIFDANFTAYNLLIADSNIQESNRLARSIMIKDIQNAATLGCSKDGQVYINGDDFGVASHPVFQFDAFTGFSLINNVEANKKISDISDLHVNTDSKVIETGTDVLGMIKATALSVQLTAVSTNTVTIQGSEFNANDYLMVMNCTDEILSEVFHVQSVAKGTNSQVLTLHRNVAQERERLVGDNGQLMSVAIYKLEAISYFIAEGLNSTTYDKRYSLHRKVNNNAAVEYISGVDDLQIDYETVGGTRSYIAGSATSQNNEDMANIVHINLVLRSDSAKTHHIFVGPDYGKISANAHKYPDDGKLRRLVSFSGKIRGRN